MNTYSKEEQKWFNQVLLTHYDNQFQSKGYLRISFSSNTSNYQDFNPIVFQINISNENHSLTQILNIQNATDFLLSCKDILSSNDVSDFRLIKKYSKSQNLILDFLVNKDIEKKLVKIQILRNESDFTDVIIDFHIFQVIIMRLKYFVNNYDNLVSNYISYFLLKEILISNNNVLKEIKGLPSKIVNNNIELENNSEKIDEIVEETTLQEMSSTLEDFDKFIGGNEVDNIKIPDIEIVENKQENKQEFSSKFIKMLNNNLINLESLLESSSISDNPIETFLNNIKNYSNDENFKFLPDISDSDYKSLIYMSKCLHKNMYLNYIENNTIPSSIPVLKYNYEKNINNENFELALDLLTIQGYIRILRSKLESKISDSSENKSLMLLHFRCFTDPLIFTFIEKQDSLKISSQIISRYKYLESIGFFDEYNALLQMNNLSIINEVEMNLFIDEVFDKVVGKTSFINELHNKYFKRGNLDLNPENNFSVEQITKEIIPLEIAKKSGININKDKELDKISGYSFSKESLDYFRKKQKVKNKSIKYVSNLDRYYSTQLYSDEVPEIYKEKLHNVIRDIGNNNFEFEMLDFPFSEFGENIIKALYLWKPKNNEKLLSYKEFMLLIENEIMTKDLILSSISNKQTNESKKNENNNEDWSDLVDII